MGGEEAFGTLLELLYWVDDVEVGGGPVRDFEDLAVAGDLLQGVSEALGVAGELYGGGVREILPLAAYGELKEPGEERGQYREHYGDDHHDELCLTTPLPPAAATSEPQSSQEEVGDENGGADEDAY